MKKLLLSIGLLWFSFGQAQGINYNLFLQDSSGAPVPGIYAILSDSSNVFNPVTVGLVSDQMGMVQHQHIVNSPGTFIVQVFDFCTTYTMVYSYTPNTSVINDTLTVLCPVSVPAGPNCNFLVDAMPLTMGGNDFFFWNLYLGAGPTSVFTWDFGDGTTATGSNATHVYNSPGTYVYCLTVDSCQVCDTVVVGGTGGGGANCNFQINSWNNGATNLDYSFWTTYNNQNPNSVYSWDFGDGNTGTGSLVTHSYATAGTYNVCITVDSCNVCETVVVGSGGGGGPAVGALYASGYALGSALPSGAWVNTEIFIQVDNYITSVFTDQNGFYADSLPVTSNSGLLMAYAIDCAGQLIGGVPYLYDISAGIVSFHDTIMSGCLASTGSGSCQAQFIVDTVNSFGGNVYLWNTSVFSNPASQGSYLWDFGDGTFSNSQYPTHQYAQPGMYQVCLTITEPASGAFPACTSVYCDSLGMDANGNLIYKGQSTGFNLIVIDPATIGQDENKLEGVTVYPNPASDYVKIDGLLQSAEYSLMDAYGRVLQTGEVNPGQDLNLPEVSQGVYILDLLSDGKRAQLRLLVN